MTTINPESDLLCFLQREGYFNLRILHDGSIIGCYKMLFTTAVCIDMNRTGYGKRYCYPTNALAVECCNKMLTADTPPIPGFTAIK